MIYRVGFGQDSHKFRSDKKKKCVIAGIIFDEVPGFDADSDGDVVFHSICNAITSVTHISILGSLAKKLCLEKGVVDSRIYLMKALETLDNYSIRHVALSLEGARPRFEKKLIRMRENVAKVLGVPSESVGITTTSGDGMNLYGTGGGIMCMCVLTVSKT